MNTAKRSKLSQMSNLKKDVLLSTKSEKIEMTLNTENSLASGLLIQRLTELYEDPIEASVRETISNAFDAVTEAYSGERPEVRITTPTSLSPIMIIKDNGVGMDYEDLKNIYSKYGASTKVNDLDQIGAYGLGAKSPLAYGTEFTVSSVKNGHKVTIIVAREELTNYIKIINNVKTDEASGTTVSIPVNSRDIDRFNENIDKYRSMPLDKDLDLYVNERLIENDEFTLLTENALILDGAEKVYGRIWVRKNNFTTLITNMTEEDVKRNAKYLIGGWTYESPAGRNNRYYRNQGKEIVVELKAGIVGFNSSRDAILENDRYYELEKLVVDYVKSEKFMKDITKSINALDIDNFKKNMYELFETQRRWVKIEDGKIMVETRDTGGYYSSIPRKFKFEDFVHNETKFTLDHLIKNVPEETLSTVVIRESKDSWRKTGRNAIMSNKIYNSSFSSATIQEINEYIDDVVAGETLPHKLDILIMNLSSIVYNDQTSTKVTFITEMDDHITQLKPMRKAIIRMRNNDDMETNYSSIIIFTSYTTEQINKSIEGLGFENFDLEINTAEEIIEKVKKFRAKNRVKVEERTVNEKLATMLKKYDFDRDYTYNVNVTDIDDEKENLIIVSKSYVSDQLLWQMHAWYCNENKLKPNELDIYVSIGNHRVIDLNILMEMGVVMRDPYSEAAGLSKLYQEEIHDNVAKMNALRESDVDTSEKAFLRLLSGIYGYGPTSLAELIKENLDIMYNIAEIADYDMPEFPKEIIDSIKDSPQTMELSVNGNSNWRLNDDAIKHLASKVDEKHYELLSNLSLIAAERLVVIKDDEVDIKYVGSYKSVSAEEVTMAYNNESSMYHSKLVKAKMSAELEFISSVVKDLMKFEIK